MNTDIISLSSSPSSACSSSSDVSTSSAAFETSYGFPPSELVALLARHMDNQGRSLPRLFLDQEGIISLGREGYEIEAWQLWDFGMKLGGWDQVSDPITATLLALRLSLPPKLTRSIRLPPLPARPASNAYHPGPRSPEFPSRTDEARVILQAVWYHYFAAFEVVQMIRVGMAENRREREREEKWRKGVRDGWREMVLERMASRGVGGKMEVEASEEQVDDDAEEEEEDEDEVKSRMSLVDPPNQPAPYPTPPSESRSLPDCANIHQRSFSRPPSPPPTVLRRPNQLAQSALSTPSPLGRAKGTLIPIGHTAYEVLQTPPSGSRPLGLDVVIEESSAPTRLPTLPNNERQLLFTRPDQLTGPSSGQHISRPSFRIGAIHNVQPPDRTSTSTCVPTSAAATRKRPLDHGLLAPSKRQHCSGGPIGDCPVSRVDSPPNKALAGWTVILGSDITGDETRLKLEAEVASLAGIVGTRRTREDWVKGSENGREVMLVCWTRKGEEVSRAIATGAKLHTPLWLSTFNHPNLTASLPKTAFAPRLVPLRGFESFKISLTSYLPPLKTILIGLITSTGATYSPNLTKSCTHLLCPAAVDEAGTQKLQQAEKAGIRVVRDAKGWLERAIEAGGNGKGGAEEMIWEDELGGALKGLSITEV